MPEPVLPNSSDLAEAVTPTRPNTFDYLRPYQAEAYSSITGRRRYNYVDDRYDRYYDHYGYRERDRDRQYERREARDRRERALQYVRDHWRRIGRGNPDVVEMNPYDLIDVLLNFSEREIERSAVDMHRMVYERTYARSEPGFYPYPAAMPVAEDTPPVETHGRRFRKDF